MTSGFVGHTSTAPTDELEICPSVTGAHSVPPSVVFRNPPPVAPKKYSFGRAELPATAIERPPSCGPTLRHFRPAYSEGSTVWDGAAPAAADAVSATPSSRAAAPAISR